LGRAAGEGEGSFDPRPIKPTTHQEVMHTIRLLGEQVIPYFVAKQARAAAAK